MMVPRLAAVLLLCALAAGQQEQKTIADFQKPFRIVANLIVDKNFFLLRELTPEEQKTGKVDLEDPFNEKSRPKITTTTTTTTTTTRRPTPRNRFVQDISGLLPPPPSATAASAQKPSSGSGRFFFRPPTPAVGLKEAAKEPVRPAGRRRGSVRRKVVRVPARRRTTTSEAPATAPIPTTSTTTTTTRRPVSRRQPVAAAAPVRAPAIRIPTLIPIAAPLGAPVRAPIPVLVRSPVRGPVRVPVVAKQTPAQGETRFDAAAAVVASIPGTSRRVVRVETESERENEINSLHRRLPSGSKTVVRDMESSDFSCRDRPYGYYADMQADCQVFHICTPITHPDGFQQNLKHSLFCNNGTRFDQRTLTCRDEALALPCAESGEFYTSVKFFEKFDIFERARAEDERRRTKILRRLETLEDVEALEAQLDE